MLFCSFWLVPLEQLASAERITEQLDKAARPSRYQPVAYLNASLSLLAIHLSAHAVNDFRFVNGQMSLFSTTEAPGCTKL